MKEYSEYLYAYIVNYKYPNGDGRMTVFRDTKVITLSDFYEVEEYVKDFNYKTLNVDRSQIMVINLIELVNK